MAIATVKIIYIEQSCDIANKQLNMYCMCVVWCGGFKIVFCNPTQCMSFYFILHPHTKLENEKHRILKFDNIIRYYIAI